MKQTVFKRITQREVVSAISLCYPTLQDIADNLNNAYKKLRGSKMLNFEYDSYKGQLKLYLYPGDFSGNFELVSLVCNEVISDGYAFIEMSLRGTDALTARAILDKTDYKNDGSDRLVIRIYSGEGERLNSDVLSFQDLGKWAEDIRKYINSEVGKYKIFAAYYKVYMKYNAPKEDK